MAALEELKAGTPVKATWVKAIAHSNGDENSTKAKYLLFRAEQIRADALKERIVGVVEQSSVAGLKGAKIIFRVAICIGALFLIYPALLSIALGIDFWRDGQPISSVIGTVVGVALLMLSGFIFAKWGPSAKGLRLSPPE